MIPIRQILVPLDFGDASMAAVRRAVDLARSFDATLTLLHVVDFPSYVYSEVFTVGDLFAEFQDAASKRLDDTIARVCAEYPRTRAQVRPGSASSEILSTLEDVGADLVVMGTRGRHGVAHALLGSVAERVVRLSPVPVLTVRQNEGGDVGNDAAGVDNRRPVRSILVPTDFGEVAEHALDEAMELAASLGAIVTVLHAYEYSLLGIGVDFGTGVPDAPERLKRAAREALRETIERQSGRGVVLDGILREGAPWSAIVEFAAGSNADLIVIGTRGRRGLARAFLGSVAEKVVRYASVPVLTVHASPDVAVVAREPSRGQAPRSEGVGR